MEPPLVSIICICHNHRRFVQEAVLSALDQTHVSTEVIVVDDRSTDGSAEFLQQLQIRYPRMVLKLLATGSGLCKAFNTGWKLSSGEYIIDLSADDVLLPGRVEEGVRAMEKEGPSCGINFTDAEYVDENGKFLRYHFPRDSQGHLRRPVPQGYLYPQLLARYIICPPTMMYRKAVIEYLGGYDESLAYEDFDVWIRSGKKFRYGYTDRVLVKKRILQGSLSRGQYARNSPLLKSTYEVCLKAEKLNESEEDRKALISRARYEFRKSLFSGNRELAGRFLEIMERNRAGRLTLGLCRILFRAGYLLPAVFLVYHSYITFIPAFSNFPFLQ